MEYDQDDDDDETWMPTFEEIGALPCSSESSKLSNEMWDTLLLKLQKQQLLSMHTTTLRHNCNSFSDNFI